MLLGHPVSHSLSPLFQNAALEACALPQRYEALDVAPHELSAVVARLRAYGAAGNVTIPHKGAMLSLARHRTEVAERALAVNTFWFEGGELVGHNTDVAGVQAAIGALLPQGIHGGRCALLGAGGAAGAALVALHSLGCSDIRAWSRTPSRLDALAAGAGVPVTACDSAAHAVRDATLVVNATPVGLHDDAMVIPPASLPRSAAVLDLVYKRGETAWVRACRANGMRAQDGLCMLVEQGAAAFTCWFGVEAPRDAMWRALRDADAVRER